MDTDTGSTTTLVTCLLICVRSTVMMILHAFTGQITMKSTGVFSTKQRKLILLAGQQDLTCQKKNATLTLQPVVFIIHSWKSRKSSDQSKLVLPVGVMWHVHRITSVSHGIGME